MADQMAFGTKPYSGLNLLVTGADGFIGSHLSERLLAVGANVTALCLYNATGSCGCLDSVAPAVRRRMRVMHGDVRDAAFMRRLLEEQDVVFHLAALTDVPHSYVAAQTYLETNVTGTLNLLEAAREHGVRRVVHTSSGEVYGGALATPGGEGPRLQARSPAAASMIGADMLAEAFACTFDQPVVILRPFDVFGPRQRSGVLVAAIIRQAIDPSLRSLEIGEPRRMLDLTFVADIVDAFLAVGVAPGMEFGRAYNAGSGMRLSVGRLAELVSRVVGTNKPVLSNSARIRPLRPELGQMSATAESGAIPGWRPRTPLRVGLSRTIEWWRSRHEGSWAPPEMRHAI